MKNLLTTKEIKDFKSDGAIVLRKKFDISWIEKLKKGITKDIKSIVVGMGVTGMHTINETVSIPDLVDSSNLCQELILSNC